MILISLPIAAHHPAYSGHFPGNPMLPGVVLLDAALHALESAGRGPSGHWQIGAAKFHSSVRPAEALTLQLETHANGSVRFAISTADRTVASGVLVPSQASTESYRGEQS